ncbi:MAG: hypothetical protein AAFU79_07155 [Myxococcota bacterium]
MMSRTWIFAGLAAASAACTQTSTPSAPPPEAPSGASPSSLPSSSPASQPASGPSSAAGARAAAGRARLEKTDAGRAVLAAAQAHGGLEQWFEAGALAFTYDYQPVEGPRRTSHQVVDLLSARAYHEMTAPVTGQLAFDGKMAWFDLKEGETYPARFWALTPYYFVGMPFVLSDAGVNLAFSEDDPVKAGFARGTQVVKATFDPGTGDAPDDYYVLYLDGKTHMVLGLRYVVSYAPFMREGMSHTPEKLLVYEDYADYGGVKIASREVFFAFAEGKKGPKVTLSEVSRIELPAAFDARRLEKPAGGVVDDALGAGH